MSREELTPWTEPNLNALLTCALRRYGNREAMYNGDEAVTYSTLFRRAVALSCFVDEAAGDAADEADGCVVLYLPSGLVALRSLLAVSLAGRTAVPVDALARARRTPGADPATRFEERELADLRSLSSPVRLILTVTPLARYIDTMKSESGLSADCPVLFADEAANRMDDSHQEKIRTRLADAMAGKLGHARPGDIAIDFGRPRGGGGHPSGPKIAGSRRLNQAQLMEEVASAAKAVPPSPDSGALVMTSTEEATTWTHGYLAALATGARLNFMRFFYPTHIARAIGGDHARSLLLSPSQYEALARELKSNGTAPELRCLINGIPSAELIASWGEASDSPIEPIIVAS